MYDLSFHLNLPTNLRSIYDFGHLSKWSSLRKYSCNALELIYNVQVKYITFHIENGVFTTYDLCTGTHKRNWESSVESWMFNYQKGGKCPESNESGSSH